jgi:hypothetical protein
MTTRKVRVGSWYAFVPVMMDVINPPIGHPSENEILKVINKFGCPKANVMGQCYVEDGYGNFMGMVSCNSLQPMRKKGGRWYKVEEK